METALGKLSDQGLVGILLVLALGALAYVYRTNQKLHEQGRADQERLTTALIESASAMRDNTKVVEQCIELVRQLTYKNGGAS